MPTRRALLLLAQLAVRPGKAFSRDALGELLWPEGDPERQRANLRVELLFLRRALGENVLQNEGKQFLRLGAGWSSDVGCFEAAALAAHRAQESGSRLRALREAAQSYRGDFLVGYDEDWVLLERARLQELFHDVLRRLIAELEREGAEPEAASYRIRFAQHFPDRPAPTRLATTGCFVGRERELAQARSWLLGGGGRILTVTGPPGMGKSRLAQEALRGRGVAQHTLTELAGLQSELDLDCVFVDAVPEGANPLLNTFLQRYPTVRLLLTAAKPLGLPGECTLALAPLTSTQSLQLLQQASTELTPSAALELLAGNPRALELALALHQAKT